MIHEDALLERSDEEVDRELGRFGNEPKSTYETYHRSVTHKSKIAGPSPRGGPPAEHALPSRAAVRIH